MTPNNFVKSDKEPANVFKYIVNPVCSVCVCVFYFYGIVALNFHKNDVKSSRNKLDFAFSDSEST